MDEIILPSGFAEPQRPVFERAPFPLYGLHDGWKGQRFLGGTHKADDDIVALSLLFRTNEDDGPTLIVETAAPSLTGWGGTPLELAVEKMWAGYGDEDELRGIRFDEITVVVEGVPVWFRVGERTGEWIARGMVGDLRLTLRGHHGFPMAGIELVRVTDISTYIES